MDRGRATVVSLSGLWRVNRVEAFTLIVDSGCQWSQGIEMLARVVAAEEQLATGLHDHTNICGCAATIATVCGRQWSGGRQGRRHLSTSYIRVLLSYDYCAVLVTVSHLDLVPVNRLSVVRCGRTRPIGDERLILSGRIPDSPERRP